MTLQANLAELSRKNVTHAILEASSHGLDQRRMDEVSLTAAAFTNLTREHLDYHGTFEKYFAAKKRLFAELLPKNGVAILNADAPEFWRYRPFRRTDNKLRPSRLPPKTYTSNSDP